MKKLGKHLGKMIALIVSAVMIICQMDIPVLADSEDCYEIYEWSDVYSRYCKNHYSLEYITNKCDVLSADYTWEEYNNSNTWYLAKGSIIVAGRVIVNGNVNLLLYDNCVLNMPYGIYVPEGSSLTIYNQYVAGVSSENKTYGILNTGFGNGIKECESSDAGIGGGYSNITGSPNPNCGNVTIHGGTINVKGGRYAAGIGGGRGGNGGTVTIYDGTVNVEKGNYAVGIGGGNGYDGYDGSTGGNGGAGNGITVNGGTVTVKCGNDSTGIGGGQGGSASDTGGNGGAGDNISVNGGTVTVECGQNSTGIGGGQGGNGYTGGNGGTGNNISVNGGTVTVKCGDKSTGIGGGNGCNGYTGGNGGAGNGITVKGGTVTVECGGLSTGIGGGKGGFGNSNSGSDGSGNVELGWTDISDSISATNYTGDVKLASVKDFWYKSGGAYEGVEINNNRKVTSDIAGKTLYPINTYAITTTQPTGGTLTANKRSVSGNSITVTGVPTDNSNELGTLTVTKAGSGTVTASGSGNTRTFVMPADDVTVTGTFGAPAEVPVISTQPSNIELTEGYTTGNVLTVAATCVDGHTLSYQWYSNTTNSNTGGTIISGATEASYTIPAGGTAGTAYYYCEVTSTRTEGGTFKTVASNAAKVQITAAAPHTHTYTDSIKTPASCTEPGEMMHRCTGCDYFYTSVIPALGHDFSVEGRVIKQPTLLTEGEKELKCSRCNATKTVTIPKLQPESQEEAEAINEIIEALTDENGNLKVEINATTVENEDGTTVTTVTIDGQEVIKIITDEDGDETVESNIWTIEEEDDDLKYTGAAITPGIHVFDGIHKLSEGSEYAVKYGNNVNASEKAWIYVSFGGSYKGTPAKTVYFTIKPADLQKDVSAENLVVASSKKLQAPIPTITLSNGTVINKQLAYRYLDSE
ncbi:MAG: hypothetical protein IK111_09575, partial [Lachnospiraceae bacterium]|nr:hypothetical protein [Lachnospiraceae bacterium]